MPELTHVIYASKAMCDFSSDDIKALLFRAREKNAKLQVTGMLLFDRGTFFQVIEGETNIIQQLFADISNDKRHAHIINIISEAIPRRQFGRWSMGYAHVDKDELSSIDGMNDFFQGAQCLTDIDAGRAKKLLKAFAQGRWRIDGS